jgi:glyceraldehyde-3-phosphate dehydrogenase/erythrose-4-phosphate dehydrogenase
MKIAKGRMKKAKKNPVPPPTKSAVSAKYSTMPMMPSMITATIRLPTTSVSCRDGTLL